MLEFLTKQTTVVGVEIPNWLIIVGAIVLMLVVYAWAQKAKPPH